MKSEFSIKWKGSKQPRKQRKYLANAPIHIKHKMLSSNLNKDLRKKYKKRSFPVRKGDSVKIMRGEFKKKKAKIEIVDVKRLRVSIEGIQRTKKDGSKINIWFRPSNLQIQELNLNDKKRLQALQRKTNLEQKTEEKNKAEERKTIQKSKDKNDTSKKK